MMRLTVFLLFAACLQLSAKGWAQHITLSEKGAPLEKVIRDIQKQSSYAFFYDHELLQKSKPVTVTIAHGPLLEALARVFKDQPLTYEIIGDKIITIKEKEISGNTGRIPDVPDTLRTIHGEVTNETGDPVVGASIRVKDGSGGTVTDTLGRFILEVPENAVLEVSYLGYGEKEIAINGKAMIHISLMPATTGLNQLVVVGYGTQKKIDVTAPIASVKGSDISKQPSTNAISGLQGKVAGVQIVNSGSPGASPQIRIRGVGSINGGLNPLYVVDGIWANDISFLNPSDIESISILKDASAGAIYGNRSANGVVVITTKKGKSGPAVITYTGSAGWQKITNELPMANAYQYAIMANGVNKLNGDPLIYGPDALYNPGVSDRTGTNWFHQLFRQAFITNHQLSMSGGTDKTSYSYSLSYLDQDGIVKTQNYKRYTARLQNEFRALSFLKIGYNLFGTIEKSNDINGDIFRQAYASPPVIPVKYADGSYGDPADYSLTSIGNPEVTLDFNDQHSQKYLLLGNTYININLPKHLSFRSNVSFEYDRGEQFHYTPVYKATSMQYNDRSSLTVSRNDTKNWQIENMLFYKNTFNDKHHLKVMLAQSARRNKTYYISGTAWSVPNEYAGELYLSLGENSTQYPNTASDGGALSTGISYFGRINYSYLDKYLLTFTYRADGSSKYTGTNRWGYFPSLGLAWIISDESFMKKQQLFDVLKLRGSWGINGNVDVPSNITTLTASPMPYAVWNGTAYPSRSIVSVVPPQLFWEKGVTADIGLEMTLLQSRLMMDIDLYNRDTKNTIFSVPILASDGLGGGIEANQATIRNRGFEVSATWNGKIGGHIKYAVSGNYSYNVNKVTRVNSGTNPLYGGYYSNPSALPLTRTVVGQPIGMFYGYQVMGVFQTQDQVQKSTQSKSAMAGDLIFKDQNGDGVIDDRDKIYMGNPNPKDLFGLSLEFSYDNFDLSIDLQGVAGVSVYNANMGKRYGIENFTKEFYEKRWHGPGTSNTYPSANLLHGMNTYPNTFWVENGSYIRIRNINAGYNIHALKKWKITNLRVFTALQNPFNFFSYKGFTPEIPAGGNSPINAGIDAGIYPLTAFYTFGVKITL